MGMGYELRRRTVIPLVGMALAAVYIFVFSYYNRQAESLDVPLGQAWRKLAGILGQTNATQLDFVAITNQLSETRHAIAALETARKVARTRVQLSEDLRNRMNEYFQLVEYDNEIGHHMGELSRLARLQKVTLEPGVFGGFPEQTADMQSPELLWAELEFINALLTSAINSKVTTIHSVSAPLPLTNAPPGAGVRTLIELPVQLELSGPARNVTTFLKTLPLRAEEMKAAGLPETTTNKPALFVDRLILRKQSPEKPDEVRLSLRATGFVFVNE